MIDKTQQNQLISVLKDAETATDCRVHLVCQRAASGYVWTSLVCAALVTLIATALISVTQLSLAIGLGLQALAFAITFCGVHFTVLKYRLTPHALKQAFAHRSLGRALQQVANEKKVGQAQSANVVVLVSQEETFAEVIPSSSVARQVPASVWKAINDSLLIDVGHGDFSKGLRNSANAITKLLKVYFPAGDRTGKFTAANRLVVTD